MTNIAFTAARAFADKYVREQLSLTIPERPWKEGDNYTLSIDVLSDWSNNGSESRMGGYLTYEPVSIGMTAASLAQDLYNKLSTKIPGGFKVALNSVPLKFKIVGIRIETLEPHLTTKGTMASVWLERLK